MAAHRKERKELSDTLTGRISRCEELSTSEAPNKRSLQQKVNELRDAITQYETHHFKFISEEENDDIREDLNIEYNEIMRRSDAVLFPAEDILDTLEAADSTPVIGEADQVRILTGRLAAAKQQIEKRGKFIEDSINALHK